MGRSLILLDDRLDGLGRCYLKSCGAGSLCDDSVELVNLEPMARGVDGLGSGRNHPHYLDLMGWRRWLKERRIERLDCYQVTNKTAAVLAWSWMAGVDNTIVLTGRIDAQALRRIRLVKSMVRHYRCWAEFVAADIRQIRMAEYKIEVAQPTVALPGAEVVGDGCKDQVEGGGPILLALDAAANSAALQSTIKAAAILRHMVGTLRLVVAGPGTEEQCRRLLKHEEMHDVKGMIHIDRDETDWRMLCKEADVVIVPNPRLVEIMRLLQARELGTPIVAVRGDSDEILAGYEHSRMVASTEIRGLATAIADVLGQDVIMNDKARMTIQ